MKKVKEKGSLPWLSSQRQNRRIKNVNPRESMRRDDVEVAGREETR
jgi:hypothetical protein